MMSYRLWERKENSFGGLPVERPHGEVVILSLSDSQLFLKILKGIEGMAVMVVSRVMRKIKRRFGPAGLLPDYYRQRYIFL